MAGHRPAIVERPNNRLPGFLQILEKRPDMKIISVERVQVDDVRVVYPDPFDQPFGRFAGIKTGAVGRPRPQRVREDVPARTDAIGMFAGVGRNRGPPAVGDHAFMTPPFEFGGDVGAKSAGTQHAVDRIDDQNFHVVTPRLVMRAVAAWPRIPGCGDVYLGMSFPMSVKRWDQR